MSFVQNFNRMCRFLRRRAARGALSVPIAADPEWLARTQIPDSAAMRLPQSEAMAAMDAEYLNLAKAL